jgi:hypothetical protein
VKYRLHGGLTALLALVLLAGAAAAQAAPSFAVRADEDGRPVLQVSRLLSDPALRHALDSGLPLRFHLRVELWRKAFFDHLTDTQEIYVALVQDPLDHAYVLDAGRTETRFDGARAAEAGVERVLRPALRPSGHGRFYYLATLEVETLSLSDLQELRRWLRGSVGPAVEGESTPERALASGLERVLVRVMGLPTRRYAARSQTFVRR